MRLHRPQLRPQLRRWLRIRLQLSGFVRSARSRPAGAGRSASAAAPDCHGSMQVEGPYDRGRDAPAANDRAQALCAHVLMCSCSRAIHRLIHWLLCCCRAVPIAVIRIAVIKTGGPFSESHFVPRILYHFCGHNEGTAGGLKSFAQAPAGVLVGRLGLCPAELCPSSLSLGGIPRPKGRRARRFASVLDTSAVPPVEPGPPNYFY